MSRYPESGGRLTMLVLAFAAACTAVVSMASAGTAPAQTGGSTPRGIEVPAAAKEFEQRCADVHVVLCDPLDTGRVHGVGVTPQTTNATLPEALAGKYRDWRWCSGKSDLIPAPPTVDSGVKTSGTGSLKFTVPSRSDAGAGGSCQINFTPDNSIQFGEGQTFFVQFRVRFSCDLLFVDCDPGSPTYKKERRAFRREGGGTTGFKVSIINAGDHPTLKYPVSSCTRQHLVLNHTEGGAVSGYHSCGWYSGHSYHWGRAGGSGIWNLQPGRECYSRHPRTGQRLDAAWHECVLWWADEWMTVTQQVTIGRWVDHAKDPDRSSNVRIWVAREGQSPVLAIDFDRQLRGPEHPVMKYGKIWLLPYMTKKDPTEVHPEAYMWFDELIVSRGPIAPAR